ncbi:hypothetical protein [Hoeflea sp. TYP-13]|uniref:hypothetical protein n=1 Tax=Hoeflea sp. TYP-13 TaxID=3230023 RepID=UPI0034C5BA59
MTGNDQNGNDQNGGLFGAFAGIVAQAIIDLIVIVGGYFALENGVIDDPFFGAYWWGEYKEWTILFVLALVAGSAISIYLYCLLPLVPAGLAAFVFIYFYENADCTEFGSCNLYAFLGFGCLIAFLIPVLVCLGLALIRKLA